MREADRQWRAAGRLVSALPLFLLTLVLAWSPARAADLNQWVPGLKVTPFLTESVMYETNVFQVPSHSQSDVIFRTMPGILADYTAGLYTLSAGYRAEFLNYDQLTAQNNVHHLFTGQFLADLPHTLITLRDDFTRTSDPPGTELTGPVMSTTNVLSPSVEYKFSPTFSTGLGFSWLHQSFDQSSIANLIDRDEYAIRPTVYMRVLPKTDLTVTYIHGWTDFTQASDRNYTYNGFSVGVRGSLTAKLSSTFQVGYAEQSPDHTGQVGFSGWTSGGETAYRPTERTTITLATLRTWQASTDGSNPYYVTTSAVLSASQQLLPKVSLTVRVGGGLNDYPLKDTINGKTDWRQDTFLVAGGSIDYFIRPWLGVGLDYLRTSRNSNFSLFDFVDERISGRVTVKY